MRPTAHPPVLGWKAEARQTVRLAWPLALANLLQMLTYAVDVIFIARLGADELAASALSVAIFGLVLWSLSSLAGAVAPIMAAELGARAPALRPVRRTVRMGLWHAALLGAAAMALCAQAEQIMLLTGQDPKLAALANYAFVFGNLGAPEMGLAGAALATVITSLAILLSYVVAIRLDPRLHRYRVFGFFWRPDWHRFAEIWRIGTPIALTVTAEAGIFGAAAFLMGLLGAQQLAAHTVAMQIAALAFQIPHGISQGATIRVGYYFGARATLGVARAGWTGIAIGAGFMATTAIAMLVAPEYLLAVYLDPWDPANAQMVQFATTYLLVAAAFQLFDGIQAVTAGALRGLKDTRVPMWIAIFAYWVPGFGLAMTLGFFTSLGGLGVWLGLAAGLVCSAILLLWRWHHRERLGLLASGIA